MIRVHDCTTRVVADILRRQPLSRHKVDFAWRVAVGPGLARATSVTLLADGTLEVQPTTPHWRREVDRCRGLIKTRLDALLGRDVVRVISVLH